MLTSWYVQPVVSAQLCALCTALCSACLNITFSISSAPKLPFCLFRNRGIKIVFNNISKKKTNKITSFYDLNAIKSISQKNVVLTFPAVSWKCGNVFLLQHCSDLNNIYDCTTCTDVLCVCVYRAETDSAADALCYGSCPFAHMF